MQPTIPTSSNHYIESQLDQRAVALGHALNGDVLTYAADLLYGADGIVREIVEEIQNKQEKLIVVVETSGGFIEAVQRMAECFRKHYKTVDFIVPDHAMSAGTVLVMSGDAIYMDYFSVMGPIDPQVEQQDGSRLIPALGYLVQYERLLEKSRKGTMTTAELHFLVEKFDPAELYQFEQARELSITLLKEWLVKYKFKNWNRTATRGKIVTAAMRKQRASQIARELNNTEKWHSHGRGISMEVLKRDLNLQIEDFGKDPNLNEAVRSYHRLMIDYMMRRGHTDFGAIHTIGNYRSIGGG